MCVKTVAKKNRANPRCKYNFEEAWRFLYQYGVIYLQVDDQLLETKTAITKTNTPSRKILRFTVDGDEVVRVCNICWEEETSCDGMKIENLRDSLVNYIDSAFIG